ncbi:uncharacterized protein LOC114867914 [Betta splendens]|uniref:Uncharacterized protein LOC114867914 n=1 Tax=Betta splendens TaxID=158456 RepID=A0A6P7P3L5_BETSP|nr:uncharacterized protein LOC114867914 [Betta splendens]
MQMLVVFVILVHVSHHASAVVMYTGDWFLLPCEFPTFDVDEPTVVWSRSDLSPSTVHQRQQDGDKLKDQNQLYRGRTSMSTNAINTGDLSLNLTRLMLSDSGTYTCSVSSPGAGKMSSKSIHLQVKEQFPSWATACLVVLAILLLVAGGLLIFFRHYFMSVYQVSVKPGKQSVLLPCKTIVHLPEDIRLVWRDRDNKVVHVYENGQNQDGEQDNLYRQRTEMNSALLKTGNLSLGLKNPTYKDRGTFTCIVSNKEGNTLVKKRVILQVKAQLVEVKSGVLSVLLPCKTTVHLPEDTRVEWKDMKNRMVCAYENGSEQPGKQDGLYKGRTQINTDLLQTGDVSVKLENPTDADRGTFTCTVYKELNILVKKQVVLHVKVQPVEVKSGEKFVLLPCEATVQLPEDIRVEWMDSDDNKVHVYQYGSDQPEEQHRYYRGRTEMQRNPVKPGDVSVRLKNPTHKDTCTFTCTVYNREGNVVMKKQVDLRVKVQQVEVKLGEESVLLPCEATGHLPEDVRVEWMDSDDNKVHVYENGSDQPGEQHSLYRGRTEMKRNPVKPGDVSVSLKNPTDQDTGTFTCTVYNREGNVVMKKQVELKFKGQYVKVESGEESVLLPCEAKDLPEDIRVEWKDSKNRTVHVCQNGSDQPEDQHIHYNGRTEMNRDESSNALRPGDLSLSLMNPTDGDRGTFTCTIYNKEGKILMKKHVVLQITVQQVEVESGEESVLLPCKTVVQLPEFVKVEWKDHKNNTVHLYQNGSDHPEEQHNFYKGRTEIKKTLLKSGDVSLRLKNPTVEDKGTFICTVYNKERTILMKKQVDLEVEVQQVEVESGEDFVLLPCEAKDLPEDIRVEWKDRKSRKVHVYQNGFNLAGEQHNIYKRRTELKRNQLVPGDVSLSLKNPTEEDTGFFTCIVYNREGNILMKKQVELNVKVQQVEVESGEESVLLPCETLDLPEDIRVEWRNKANRRVHVYHTGSDQPGEQHSFYSGRTEMQRNPVKPGDVSLSLKNLTEEDTDTFTCTVFNKEGNILMKKQVELEVKERTRGPDEPVDVRDSGSPTASTPLMADQLV